jgi:hypothetical protein
MLSHQAQSNGANEQVGVARAFILSTTIVLLSAFAVSACNQSEAALSAKENDTSATALDQESLKAKESAYFQHKKLGGIFAETHDPR